MVTKYDVFNIVEKSLSSITPAQILRELGKEKREYPNIYKIVKELHKEGFLLKTQKGFQVKRNKKSYLLSELIKFCQKNNLNYNLLIDKNLVRFIKFALEKGEVSQKKSKLNPRTFSKYVDILERYGLGVIISKKPLRFKIFCNTLINNLLVYFNVKNVNFKKSSRSHVPDILKELREFKRLRKKNEQGFRKIIKEFEITFINHSLSLEGNPITLPNTVKILKKNKVPSNVSLEDIKEVQNYQQALSKMLSDARAKIPLNINLILEYHKLAMEHKKNLAGKIRKIGVHIKGNPRFKISNPGNIEKDLSDLIKKYNQFLNEKTSLKRTILFGAEFHNEFQHIHPFIDGNSRITRLITFHLLQYKGIPILDLPLGLLDEYLEKTKASKFRDDKELSQTLEKIILFNLKKINSRLEK
ncbi:MAG: Fic family protein [Nanoarchaeota archaeon]